MQLPGPIRAAIGLAANVADEARHLPDRAIELPMLAVSTALQMSLRAQQRYAGLTARGDAILTGRETSDEPPPWATFDDPVPTEDLRSLARSRLGDSADAEQLLDELFGRSDSEDADAQHEAEDPLPPPTPINAGKKAGKRAAPTKRPSTGKTATERPAATKKAGKSVSKPRHTAPSKFDDVGDD